MNKKPNFDNQKARLKNRSSSWNRRLARRILGFINFSFLIPNHITTLRIASGLGSCAALAQGEGQWVSLGGVLWVLSAFLDRCDGEFARMRGMETSFGKDYDFVGDAFINTLVFPAIGFGRLTAHHDHLSLGLSLIAAAGVAVSSIIAENAERRMKNGMKVFNGRFYFEFDDLVYLIAFFAWFDALAPLLVLAAISAPLVTLAMIFKLTRDHVNV